MARSHLSRSARQIAPSSALTYETDITTLGFADSFVVEQGVDFVLPVRSNVFEYMMGKAKAWGMVTYEQDWLISVWEGMSVTRNNATAASMWLQAMSDAAASLGLTIQVRLAARQAQRCQR